MHRVYLRPSSADSTPTDEVGRIRGDARLTSVSKDIVT